MKKDEFLGLLAEELETTKKDAREIFEKFFGAIENILSENGEALLGNLGKLVVVEKPARVAHNPQTGETIDVPAKNAIKLKVSKYGKEIVNQ